MKVIKNHWIFLSILITLVLLWVIVTFSEAISSGLSHIPATIPATTPISLLKVLGIVAAILILVCVAIVGFAYTASYARSEKLGRIDETDDEEKKKTTDTKDKEKSLLRRIWSIIDFVVYYTIAVVLLATLWPEQWLRLVATGSAFWVLIMAIPVVTIVWRHASDRINRAAKWSLIAILLLPFGRVIFLVWQQNPGSPTVSIYTPPSPPVPAILPLWKAPAVPTSGSQTVCAPVGRLSEQPLMIPEGTTWVIDPRCDVEFTTASGKSWRDGPGRVSPHITLTTLQDRTVFCRSLGSRGCEVTATWEPK